MLFDVFDDMFEWMFVELGCNGLYVLMEIKCFFDVIGEYLLLDECVVFIV